MSDRFTLLDDRKKLTPRQSMQALMSYARQQDLRTGVRNRRFVHAQIGLTMLVVFPLVSYVSYYFVWGNWQDIYPRPMASNVLQIASNKKKHYFTPEIYMKDLDKHQKDLRIRQQMRNSTL